MQMYMPNSKFWNCMLLLLNLHYFIAYTLALVGAGAQWRLLSSRC